MQPPYTPPQQPSYTLPNQPQTQYYSPGQQQYAAPTYAAPQMYPNTVMMGHGYPQTSAQLAMILASVSIFAGGICLAIPALIIANGAQQITDMHPGHPDAQSVKIAKIISWIMITITSVFIFFYVILLAMIGI